MRIRGSRHRAHPAAVPGAIGVLLVSALLSGCGFAGLLAPIAVSTAIGVGELAGSASYDAGRRSVSENSLASRTFAYPLLVVDEEVLPSVATSRG